MKLISEQKQIFKVTENCKAGCAISVTGSLNPKRYHRTFHESKKKHQNTL